MILTADNIISGSGGGCFAAGSLVLTTVGLIPIEEISIGTKVVCFDDRGQLHISTVSSTNYHEDKEVYKYTLWGGIELVATPNHWVLTNDNKFLSIGDVTEANTLVDVKNMLLPIIGIEYIGKQKVYNFIVEKYHTYIVNNIRVHNGGDDKAGSSTPVESPDTLRSTSYANILDLICEGEIEGLSTGDAKSIYINGTPVQNQDGSLNFKDYTYTFRNGTQDQTYIPGFDVVEAEVIGPGEVKKAIPKTITISESVVDRVRVTIGVPSLVKYEDNGDTVGSLIEYNISIRKNGGASNIVIAKTLSGKNTSKYQISHIITLPRTLSTDYFDITVTRMTDDSTSLKLQNTLIFDSYTKISDTKLRYPNSVLCGSKIDSSQFSSIPTRGYKLKLLKIKIPSNYNPTTRVYTGVWDGTFNYAWSDNPAWCFYDLATNSRYGLGEYIDSAYVDKWSLYTIAKYCDELVPNGVGGLEPRFTLNTYLQTREDAIKLLTDMASAFRGMVYWGGGTITLAQDSASSSPVMQFTNSNVVNGTFNYSGASKKVIHTAALVSWNDPTALYEQKIEYVEDRESIDRYGYNPIELLAFGCTSRAQAHRLGKWLLYTERVESNIVSFAAGLDSSYCRPGHIIKVFDETRVGVPLSGRIVQRISTTSVKLDRVVTLDVGKTYNIRFNSIVDGKFDTSSYIITTGATTTDTITISGSLNTYIIPGAIWSISSTSLNEELFRIIAIKESEEVGIYEISAMLHNPSKFDFIENNIVLEDRKYSTLSNLPEPIDPLNVQYIENLYINKDGGISTYLNVSFKAVNYATRYTLELKRGLGNWELVFSNSNYTNYTFENLADNTLYSIRITPYNMLNKAGPTFILNNILVKGKLKPPTSVTSTSVLHTPTFSTISWPEIADLDRKDYGIVYDSTWINNSSTVWVAGTTIDIPPQIAGTYNWSIKARDTTSNVSVTSTPITFTVQVPIAPAVSAGILGTQVKISWTKPSLTTYDIKEYIIRVGGTTWESSTPLVTVDSLSTLFIPNTSGTTNVFVKSVDLAGNISTSTGTSSFTISVPTAPSITHRFEGKDTVLSWLTPASSLPLASYEIRHGSIFNTSELITTTSSTSYSTLSSWVGNRVFWVTAVDSSGNKSTPTSYTVSITAPGSFSVSNTIIANKVQITWATPTSTVPIEYYEIRYGASWASGTFVTRQDSSSYRVPIEWVGSRTFWVAPITITGTVGTPSSTTTIISVPSAPSINSSISGTNVIFTWTIPSASLPLSNYEIRIGTDIGSSTLIGYSDTNTIPIVGSWSGSRDTFIRAIDINGNLGAYGTISTNITVPAAVPNFRQQVVDNNVLLYWDTIRGTLPTDTFELRRGAVWSTATLIGKKDGGFTSVFETIGGTYTYWIAAIDSAGNYGTPTALSCTVAQPPDYILKDNFNSILAGIKTNLFIDNGALVGPVNTTEAFAEHFTSRGWTTPNSQVVANYPIYIQPTNITASYTESIDYGTMLASSNITVTPTYQVITGSVAISCTISVSANNVDWVNYTNTFTSFASNFRYLKVLLTITAPTDKDLMSLSKLNIRLDSKLKTITRNVSCLSTDSGGTIVYLTDTGLVDGTKIFIDVDAIQVTANSTTPVIAIYDFLDEPNPLSFKILLYNTAGTRISGTASTTIRGF